MIVNRSFKDSVFTRLFGNPDLLRELYCALKGVNLPPDIPVYINTLENVLYMDLYNDISYEKIINRRNLYSNNKLIIPYPEFYVLYNGSDPHPDSKILKLSDLFGKPENFLPPEKSYPLLELEVKVININEGKNSNIINRCGKLAEYSKFIGITNALLDKLGDREDAIKKAIQHCQKHDILKEFLEIYGSEVLNMLLTEWNLDEAKKVWYEDGQMDDRTEEKIEIARNLLTEGMTLEFVHKITGLPLEEIEKIKF